MATPNIVNVATINAKNAAGAITTSRASAVDAVSYTHLTLPTNREV